MPSRLNPPEPSRPVPLPSPPTTSHFPILHPHHRLVSPPVAVAICGGAALSLSLLLLLFLFRRLNRHRTAPSDCTKQKPPHRLSSASLRRATASFAPHNLLGRGGFGSVYRGHHPTLGDIAVKAMDFGSLQGEREFQNELLLAQKIHHSPPPKACVASAIGFASRRGRRRRRMMLVYELMHGGNLQDALLHRKSPELMEWGKRFSVAVDIAKGIDYLHAFNPPIIHGDIKPSNVLLDRDFSAKIGDLGLARLKTESVCEISIDISCGLETKKRVIESHCGGTVEDSGSVLEDVESVATGVEEFNFGVNQSPESLGRGDSLATPAAIVSPETVDTAAAAASPETMERVAGAAVAVGSPSSTLVSDGNLFDKSSVDSEKEMTGDGKRNFNGKRMVSRKDWWWRQDNGDSDGGQVKSYVMDWIGTEIKKERPKGSWIGTSSSSAAIGKSEQKKSWTRLDWWKKNSKQLEWWASFTEDKRVKKKDKRRPAREWWKEEYCEELAKKKKRKKKQHIGTGHDCNEENWWPKDEDSYSERKKKSKSGGKSRGGSMGSVDWWLDGFSGELWRARQNSYDSVSGEIPKSGGISSTPSMRGTVCYVAPEYGGGECVSEKCDVYSYGVLLLVIVSGRRPLQVTGSPMSEFQRANLISWARNLARTGKLLELVDQSIQSLDQDQALLCLTVALLCLQKFPARRPSMREVVGMLCGELEHPQLPVEFSPSPPSRIPFKTRKKAR